MLSDFPLLHAVVLASRQSAVVDEVLGVRTQSPCDSSPGSCPLSEAVGRVQQRKRLLGIYEAISCVDVVSHAGAPHNVRCASLEDFGNIFVGQTKTPVPAFAEN